LIKTKHFSDRYILFVFVLQKFKMSAMKQKVAFFITSLLLAITCTAQKDAGIKSLLSASGEIVLPIQATTITQKLKIQPVIINDTIDMDAYEESYKWVTSTGLSLVAAHTDNENAFRDVSLTSRDGQLLKGLPYNLVLLGSTLKDCETRFKTLIRKKEKLYSTGNPDQLSGHRMIVKKGKYYVTLLFNKQNKLEGIMISVYDLETAG